MKKKIIFFRLQICVEHIPETFRMICEGIKKTKTSSSNYA